MKNRHVKRIGIALLAASAAGWQLGGCEAHGEAESDSVAARAQAVGAADSTDRADRECLVVLRSVEPLRNGGTPVLSCEEEGCRPVLVVSVDVAADQGGQVAVLYHSGDSSEESWWTVEARPTGPGRPGFIRYEARLSDPLPTVESGAGLDLIPYVQTSGVRLFDHNVVRDPLGTYHLGHVLDRLGPSRRICTHRPDTAALVFSGAWSEYPIGTVRAGGRLAVHYDPSRLTACRATHNGAPAWAIEAFVRFLPGGQTASGPVVAFRSDRGRPRNEAYSIPFLAGVPEDAEAVEVWFRNTAAGPSPCLAWDSDYGRNYRFEVRPPRDEDPCADRWQWRGEGRMEPTCPDHRLAGNYDATHCEFRLERFSNVETGHYGIPQHWIEAEIATSPSAGNVETVGIYVEYLDRTDGASRRAWVFGRPEGGGRWETGFPYLATEYPDSGHLYEVTAFAFFLDQRREDGSVVRLWVSRSGRNFSWEDAFGGGTRDRPVPYGTAHDAPVDAAVFQAGSGCR